MRSMSHGILAAALLGSLCIAPALGAAAKPLGSVIQSEGGSIDNVGEVVAIAEGEDYR